MKAIILAAGRGSRLQRLTDDRPKCLLPVRGKPPLEWQIGAIRGAGIEQVAIVTGYRRELLGRPDLREFHNPHWATTNMVTSLGCAAEWLQAEPCIVYYSDIFYDAAAVTALVASPADLAITFDPHWQALWEKRFADPLADAETFRLNPDGTVAEIGNQPHTLEQIQGQYMGLLRFTPAAWREVERIRAELEPAVRDRMHMTGTLQRIIEAGRLPVSAIPYLLEWGEVDCAADLSAYCEPSP